jgi:hypothetical protein
MNCPAGMQVLITAVTKVDGTVTVTNVELWKNVPSQLLVLLLKGFKAPKNSLCCAAGCI